MTVPIGYANGELSALDAYEYLEKLGVSESLYKDLAKAITKVRVPSGFMATSKKGNVFKPGMSVNTAVGENDWDTFAQNAPNRGWKIERTNDVDPFDETEEEGEVYEIPEGFSASRIKEVLGPNYTLPMLRAVAVFYEQKLQEEFAKAGDNKELIEMVEAEEEAIVVALNELAADYLYRAQLGQEITNDNYPPSMQEIIETLRGEFGDVLGNESTNPDKQGIAKPNLPTANFKVSLRTAGQKGEGGSKVAGKNVDIEALAIALYFASERGNPIAGKMLGGLREKLEKQREEIAKETRLNAQIQLSFRISDMFPGLSGADAYNLFYDILDVRKTKVGSSEERKALSLQAAIRLSEYMSPPSAGSLEEQKRLMKQQELILKMEKSLVAARVSQDSTQQIQRISNDIRRLQLSRDMIDSIASGDFVVQAAIDFGIAGLDSPDLNIVRSIFKNLDVIFMFRDGTTTLSGILETIIEEKGDNISGQLENLKELIRNRISEYPLMLRGGKRQDEVTVKSQNEAFHTIMSMMSRDPAAIIGSQILQGSLPGAESVRKLFVDHFRKENVQYGYVFNQEVAPKLSKKISELVSSRGRGQDPLDYMKTPQFQRSMQKYLESEMKLDPEFASSVVERVVSRSEALENHLNSAFGSSSSSTLSDYASRAFSALMVFSIQANANGYHAGLTMQAEAAHLMSTLLVDDLEGYNVKTGSFFSASGALFAEAVNRIRVFPTQTEDGVFLWDAGTRDAYLAHYLAEVGDTGEVVSDRDLLKFMSHTKAMVSSHHLLTSNVHNRAFSLVNFKGERLLDKTEDMEGFIRDVQSANLHDNKQLMESADVLEGVERVVARFAVGKVARRDTAMRVLLSDDPVEASRDYSIVSLANALKTSGDSLPGEAREFGRLQEAYSAVLRQRISDLSPEYGAAVSDYVMRNIRLNNVTTIGHALEAVSAVPMLISQMESSGAENISQATIEGMSGLSWTGKDGHTYNFGSMDDARNGTIDYTIIRESVDGIQVFPAEGKMESSGGSVPHLGTPDHFSALIARLWKDKGKKISINPVLVTNLPSQEEKGASASYVSLSLNYPVREIQTSGRTFSFGELISSTRLRQLGSR